MAAFLATRNTGGPRTGEAPANEVSGRASEQPRQRPGRTAQALDRFPNLYVDIADGAPRSLTPGLQPRAR